MNTKIGPPPQARILNRLSNACEPTKNLSTIPLVASMGSCAFSRVSLALACAGSGLRAAHRCAINIPLPNRLEQIVREIAGSNERSAA